MSDYPSLRPPSVSAGQNLPMGSAPIGRAASPAGNTSSPSTRYSLGGSGNNSTDNKKSGASAGLRSPGQGAMNLGAGPLNNSSAGRFGPRPSSEMIGMGTMGSASHHQSHTGGYGGQHHNPHHSMRQDSEAMDKWFEDLQHYEATLEEMAAASLDQNFKEELSAIEQWFRVLSEAERTAALYSLLQESTQVQIRFFITVLQQMARSDPSSAFLGQGINSELHQTPKPRSLNPEEKTDTSLTLESSHTDPMAEQMEAKLASLGMKSPSAAKSPASPSNRAYNRQSEAYLSPNHASMNFSPGAGSDAAATLAAQRAKLKANRVSAPGTFTGDQRTFSGSMSLDQVQERASSPSNLDAGRSPGLDGSGMRPKSIDALSKAGTGSAVGGPPRSPRRSGPLDNELSPITSTGNWASMVSTPLTNFFDDNRDAAGKGLNGQANVNLDAAANQLASVAEQQGGAGSGSGNFLLDQDVSKYQRRKSGQPGYDSREQQGGGGATLPPNLAAAWGPPGSSNDFLRQAMAPSPNSSNNNGQFSNFPTMSPNSFAGLQSPSGGFGNGLNMQMMNTMAAMGGLNMNNANAAQFLAMQQQIIQNQQQIAAMAAAAQQGGSNNSRGGRGPGGNLSPPTNTSHLSSGRRSPAPGNRGLASQSKGASAGASTAGNADEEVPELSVLNDVAAWLRHLRLHKYTPNFESSNWKEMVVMTDGDLEAKGVAALGARRKLLKTFRAVREKHGIKGKDDVEKPGDGAGAAPGSANAPSAGGEGAQDTSQAQDASVAGE